MRSRPRARPSTHSSFPFLCIVRSHNILARLLFPRRCRHANQVGLDQPCHFHRFRGSWSQSCSCRRRIAHSLHTRTWWKRPGDCHALHRYQTIRKHLDARTFVRLNPISPHFSTFSNSTIPKIAKTPVKTASGSNDSSSTARNTTKSTPRSSNVPKNSV